MSRLQDRRPDAFEGQVPDGEDPEARARPLLDRMNLLGPIRSFRVEGSIENVPGSRLAELGPDTTIVRVEFEDWIQTWSFVWNEDGTIGGTAFGGAPVFVLVPASADRYTAVRSERPWDHVAARFEDGCLVVGDLRACPEE